MATIDEIKNSIWYKKFLAERGLSEEDFDKAENKQELQEAFEEFVLAKDNDPLISTPEDEDKTLRPEVLERLKQAEELEYKAAGHHVNDELDKVAYFCALRSLSASEDEINEENLQKHIAAESNRIATEYYGALYGLSIEPNKQGKKKEITAGPKTLDIAAMVESGKSQEEIYKKIFPGGFRPNEQQEKAAADIVAHSNLSAVKDWILKIGYTSGKLLDKIQKFEQEYPITSIAASMAMSATGLGAPYMAYRMAVGVRGLYKQLKKGNLSPKALLSDGNARRELLNNAGSFVRLLPGGNAVMAVHAVSKIFTKGYRNSLKVNVNAIKEATKEIGKSGGRKGWGKLFNSSKTTLLMIGGTALAAASAYGIYNHFQADAPDIDTTPPDNTPPTDTPPVAEMTPEQVQEAARLTSEDWNALSKQNEVPEQSEPEPQAPAKSVKAAVAEEKNSEIVKIETANTVQEKAEAEVIKKQEFENIIDPSKVTIGSIKALGESLSLDADSSNSVDNNAKSDVDNSSYEDNSASEDSEKSSDVKKLKIKNGGKLKIVSDENGVRHVERVAVEDVNGLRELGVNKLKFEDNGDITARHKMDDGVVVKYTINEKGEYTHISSGNHVYSKEELDYVNAKEDVISSNKARYERFQDARNGASQAGRISAAMAASAKGGRG